MDPQPPRRSTHRTLSPKAPIVYDRWGRFGRPVLLLHGPQFDRTMWWPVAAELGGCTVIAPDLPGHGETPWRPDLSVPRLAADLVAMVNGLGLRRAPIVVGQGLAAGLALTIAEDYATHHVITLDDAGSSLADVPDFLRCYASWRPDPALLHGYAEQRATVPARAFQRRPAFAHLTEPAAFAATLHALL